MAPSSAYLRNRIRLKTAEAVEGNKSLLQVLEADATAAASSAASRSVSSTSANGASVEFDQDSSGHSDAMNQAADSLLTLYERAIAALGITETEDSSDQAETIRDRMLTYVTPIRALRLDFSTYGVER